MNCTFSLSGVKYGLTQSSLWCIIMTDQSPVPLLTTEMIERIQAAVLAVATGGGGWGSVVIVIEKGEPKRIQRMQDEWLTRRH